MRQTQADGISDSRCPQDDPGPVLPNKSPAALSSRGRRSCVDGNQKRHHGFRKIGERHVPAQAIIEFRFSIIMNSTSDLSYPTLLGEEIFLRRIHMLAILKLFFATVLILLAMPKHDVRAQMLSPDCRPCIGCVVFRSCRQVCSQKCQGQMQRLKKCRENGTCPKRRRQR